MTKRMIDFDVLMKSVNSLYTRCQVPHEKDYSLFMISRNPELSNIFMNCLDVFVREINELATPAPESQESIFDAEGWCWDLSLIYNDEEYHFLIEKTIANIGYVKANQITYYQTIGYFDFIQSNLKDTYVCLGDTLKAWRPLPTLPKEGK